MQLILFIWFIFTKKNYYWWWTRTASETCRVAKINQINRISCISLVFYKTIITKMHGTMNIKFSEYDLRSSKHVAVLVDCSWKFIF